MRLPIFFCINILMMALTASAQTAPASKSPFLTENELGTSLRMSSEAAFEDPAALKKMEDGKLISDVGFSGYSRREYSTGNSVTLSIEVIRLLDARAAYSLLTLLRTSPLQNGPPGIAFTSSGKEFCFSHGRNFVRLRGPGIEEALVKKAALSIDSRLGPERKEPPSLISHLPKEGYDAGSLHYFPAISSYGTYAGNTVPAYLNLKYDMEIAQARYFAGTRTGILSLLKFPTPELAEEFFAGLAIPHAAQKAGSAIYAKRAGPLVACLEGNFDLVAADKVLKSVRFSYSVRWVYEKGNNTKIIWGIPIGILGAVVNSLLFVGILCIASILIGAVFAVVRFMLRESTSRHSSNPDESSDITRLRLP